MKATPDPARTGTSPGRVRPFEPGDEEYLAGIYRRAVQEIGQAHYSPAQVEAWLTLVPHAGDYAARAADGRMMLVAVGADDRPVAFADLEADGHIDQFYCSPEAAGSGVTAALYGEIERRAAEQSQDRLYVEASEPARRFFQRRGFRVIHRQDLVVGGVPIHNFAMEKRLPAGVGNPGENPCDG